MTHDQEIRYGRHMALIELEARIRLEMREMIAKGGQLSSAISAIHESRKRHPVEWEVTS